MMNKWKVYRIQAAAALIIIAAGCGAQEDRGADAGSFAAFPSSSASITASASPSPPPSSVRPAESALPSPSAIPASSQAPAAAAGSKLEAASLPGASPASVAVQPSAKPEASSGIVNTGGGNPAPVPMAPAAPAADKAPAAPAPLHSAAPETVASGKEKKEGGSIQWSEFFDDDKQNTPSDKFWDMNGQTVTIKGYMGEVLSFEKNWFLVISSPGAECPFDNGDESYWNKIMIAFTDKGEKLRFTSGPLLITGRLDVGIKVDESGYKTMFRLYDAKFEKLKE
jgi:hypothetical protein